MRCALPLHSAFAFCLCTLLLHFSFLHFSSCTPPFALLLLHFSSRMSPFCIPPNGFPAKRPHASVRLSSDRLSSYFFFELFFEIFEIEVPTAKSARGQIGKVAEKGLLGWRYLRLFADVCGRGTERFDFYRRWFPKS